MVPAAGEMPNAGADEDPFKRAPLKEGKGKGAEPAAAEVAGAKRDGLANAATVDGHKGAATPAAVHAVEEQKAGRRRLRCYRHGFIGDDHDCQLLVELHLVYRLKRLCHGSKMS